jgi:peptide/nickel transport system permease protein
MWTQVARRVGQTIPVLLLLAVITFTLVSLAPGGITAFLGNTSTGLLNTPEEIERFRHIYGLDQPIPIQFLNWLANMLQGNLGLSYKFSEPVVQVLQRTVPPTIALMLGAIVIALLISIPIAVVSAFKQGTVIDHFVTFLAFVGISVPTFWLALIALLVFGVFVPVLPVNGISSNPGGPFDLIDFVRHLILPATILALPLAGAWTRFVRSSLLDVFAEPYMRTARAKGLNTRTVLVVHGLRNALLPLITLIGITFAYTVSNAAVVEYVFQWPGLGNAYILSATSQRDLPLIMGALLVVAVMAVIGSLAADLAYQVADPRIRRS